MFGLKQIKTLFLLVLILLMSACSSKQSKIKSIDNISSSKEVKEKVYVSKKELDDIYFKYGRDGLKRVQSWNFMMENAKDEKTLKKLQDVNDFFNELEYKSDSKHWQVKDYWATPFEFMGTGAGDCEDYAIAKYFSLRKLDIPDDKLRITYVIYMKEGTKFDQNHMVLTYYHKANATPIILDNINKKLKLASKRKDLKPIYSFNAKELWQEKKKSSQKVGKNNLKAWLKLMGRI